MRRCLVSLLFAWVFLLLDSAGHAGAPAGEVDFNRDIRPILSNKCFKCHGPDKSQRQGGTEGLRLDTEAGAFEDLGGYSAIVRGKPEDSELIRRVESTDDAEAMPPRETGKRLSAEEIELLRRWIREGAKYARHWSYIKPERPALPAVKNTAWPRTEVDYFLLSRLEKEGLQPSPSADRGTLVRRLSLDLTGLPPTLAEVEEFVNDSRPDAYERLVDRLLAKESFGEHWARMWLDLARYADSTGYADDPPRTIWAYRDYVIRSLNSNKPFDQFTIEQIAGDLLPDPTEDQLIATAFHRNTLTNNEGGTNDEEFRNVAVVDRVNTTMAVWMGTTIACAQCHNHKYDPITQEEYFRFFAFFNSSQDADRRDESPLLEIYSKEQRKQKSAWQTEIAELEQRVKTMTPELQAAQQKWEDLLKQPLTWETVPPAKVVAASDRPIQVLEDGSVFVEQSAETDTYVVPLPFSKDVVASALQLEALPHEKLPGNGPGHANGAFVISRIYAVVVPPKDTLTAGRFVRVEIPGDQKILSLAEVQVFSKEENIAPKGAAKQSSTDFEGPAKLAIDGNTDGHYFNAKSTTHTAVSKDPWWQLDLGSVRPLEKIVIWNRTDGNTGSRLKDFKILVLDENQKQIWEQTVADVPDPSAAFSLKNLRFENFSKALADFTESGFNADSVIDPKAAAKQQGWAIGPQVGKSHELTLLPESPIQIKAGSTLSLTIEQQIKNHTLGHFRLRMTEDPRAAELAKFPANLLTILKLPPAQRSEKQHADLTQYFLVNCKELEPDRQKLSLLKKQLAMMKPATTVPILRELPEDQRRVSKIQVRGNYLITEEEELHEGVPAAFHPLPEEVPKNRLALARWLIDENNPLTARVIANRYWEKIFGIGLVETSEEFGSQGEPPSHPELLDWLATELVRTGWDMKKFIKLLVTSSAYRQSAKVTPELLQKDPDNRLLARGPRFRMSAETIRDQALFVSGLLSPKMYGPPVKPPQPKMGLNAAFGSGIDWQTSDGDDKYRRGLYTMWRRSNPYPSMATFDAPNREVCTLRRDRTNTPLQALVTLNDPVYVEAAQSLGRRMAKAEGDLKDKLEYGFRLCVARPPLENESERLIKLYESARSRYAASPTLAEKMAAIPLGPLPKDSNPAEYAAWSVVGNVLLNLDEMFMRR